MIRSRGGARLDPDPDPVLELDFDFAPNTNATDFKWCVEVQR